MSENFSLKIHQLLVVFFALLGMMAEQPCYAMEELSLGFISWYDNERPCTRNHYLGSQRYCSRCVEEDVKEKAKEKERIKKITREKTEVPEKPSS